MKKIDVKGSLEMVSQLSEVWGEGDPRIESAKKTLAAVAHLEDIPEHVHGSDLSRALVTMIQGLLIQGIHFDFTQGDFERRIAALELEVAREKS